MVASGGLFDLCLGIARRAHEGQVDKAGAPYIGHAIRVAGRCDSETQRAVALLHDVLEDSPMTADDLTAAGVPAEVVRIVRLLTRPDGVTYMDYVRSLADDPDARAVKMADLEDNMDLSRIPKPRERDLSRTDRYRRALALLSEAKGMNAGCGLRPHAQASS